MSITALVQLYAPLAGLLILAFWTGSLSEKVRNLQGAVKKLEAEDSANRETERIIRLEVQSEGVEKTLASIDRSIQGINRQLATLANLQMGYKVGVSD